MVFLIAAVRPLREAGEPGTARSAEASESRASSAIASARLTRTVKGSVTKLVIKLLLFRIVQDRIGLGNFLEFFRCRFISGVGVRMVFLRHFTICFFYFTLRSALFNTQHFIIISL